MLRTEPLTLSTVPGAEDAFEEALSEARKAFSEQRSGTRASGPVTLTLKLSITDEGGMGSVRVATASKIAKPARKSESVIAHDDGTGSLEIVCHDQPELPGIAHIDDHRRSQPEDQPG